MWGLVAHGHSEVTIGRSPAPGRGIDRRIERPEPAVTGVRRGVHWNGREDVRAHAVGSAAMRASDLLALAVLGLVGFRLTEAARASVSRRGRVVEIVQGLRWRHLAHAVPVLFLVVPAVLLLLLVPGLDWGWWSTLGGEGNPVFGQSEGAERLGIGVVIVPVFLALLLVSFPLLVEREERIFRLGAEHRSTLGNLRRSVTFGLAHALVGIPIGAALGLSVGGLYFTEVYLRRFRATRSRGEALLESTRVHLAYDLLIVALVVPVLVTGV
jgi:hypothetical protein